MNSLGIMWRLKLVIFHCIITASEQLSGQFSKTLHPKLFFLAYTFFGYYSIKCEIFKVICFYFFFSPKAQAMFQLRPCYVRWEVEMSPGTFSSDSPLCFWPVVTSFDPLWHTNQGIYTLVKHWAANHQNTRGNLRV